MEKMKRIISVLITVVCILSISKADNYREISRVEKRYVKVYCKNNYYYNKTVHSNEFYTANCIEKQTQIGVLYYSVLTSQTQTSSKTEYNCINYGYTYGDAVNYIVTMIPTATIKTKPYSSSNYNFTDAKIWISGSVFVLYPGSEDLYISSSLSSPNTSRGYLSDWQSDTGNNNQGSLGLSFGASVMGINVGTTITFRDEFVKNTDFTNPDSGLYKMRFDFIKYNSIGYCSSSRRDRVFSNSTIRGAFQYRAVKKKLGKSYYIYFNPTFTVCDSKTWPTEIKGFSAQGSVQYSF